MVAAMTQRRYPACLLVLLTTACGPTVDIIDHSGGAVDDDDFEVSEEEDGSEVSGVDAGDEGAPMPAGGNYPSPLLADCGGLPEGVVAMPGLASAWVVDGTRPVLATEVPVDPGTARLRLASLGMPAGLSPCPDPTFFESCDTPSWMFAFDIPALAVGVQPLASIAPSYPDMFFLESDHGAQGVSYGAHVTPGNVGELEIFAITSTCVIGEIRGADESMSDTPWVRNGGFVAAREHVACVTMGPFLCE
jgi:hypothetical protein